MIFKFDIKLNFLCNREIIKLSVKFDFSELSLIFRLKFDFKFDFEFLCNRAKDLQTLMYVIKHLSPDH